jgi:hypothetical protein
LDGYLRLAAIGIGVAVPLLAAELVLRFLPVQTSLRTVAVNADNPVFHFTPERPYTYSKGWSFDLANRGRVNNAGYVNDQDYRADLRTPLLAVIGDSYVEALMVPYARTLQGRLAERTAGGARVYSFAASGAPLSQYLVWAQYARRTYGNDALVIVVVGNDIDESLAMNKTGPGFHHYWGDAEAGLELRRFDFTPNPLGRLAVTTSLGSYLAFNLQLVARFRQLTGSLEMPFAVARAETPSHVGNTEAEAPEKRLVESVAAVAAFFRDLPIFAGLPPNRVLFVVDGLRYPPADEAAARAAEASYFSIIRRHFIAEAVNRGYEAIDADRYFFDHFRLHGQRFEWPTDGHWNGLAHGIMAEAIAESRTYQSFSN